MPYNNTELLTVNDVKSRPHADVWGTVEEAKVAAGIYEGVCAEQVLLDTNIHYLGLTLASEDFFFAAWRICFCFKFVNG